MTDTPETGQDPDTGAFLVAGSPVYLRKPTLGQMSFIVLLAAIDPEDPMADSADALKSFYRVLRYLVIPPEETGDEDAIGFGTLKNQLASGEIDLPDYVGLAAGVVQLWGDEEAVEDNRRSRRAAAKKTATKAVARPGRTIKR
jgi:hypothetical protein